MFSVYISDNIKKIATTTGHLDLSLKNTRAGKSHDFRHVIVFKKLVFDMFCVITKTKSRSVFKFLRFEERFRKAPFSSQISVDGRPNRRESSFNMTSSENF